jgi:hypothetical protein
MAGKIMANYFVGLTNRRKNINVFVGFKKPLKVIGADEINRLIFSSIILLTIFVEKHI